jgi:dUTP pyrophosphatase
MTQTKDLVTTDESETVGDEKVKVRLLHESAWMPERAHDGDAGLDLRALEAGSLMPGERRLVSLGIALELPAGTAGLILGRSGLTAKHGITVLTGLLDQGYRGEIAAVVKNVSQDYFRWAPGDRIAQLLVVPFVEAGVELVDELDESERGEDGFGSTGTA